MIRKNYLVIIFLSLVITGCRPSEESSNSLPAATSIEADKEAIEQVFKQYVDVWNTADLDGVMEFIADDVVHMAPGEPESVGKEALYLRWDKFLSENTDVWSPSIDYIEISGDLAIVRESGTESSTLKDGEKTTTTVDFKGIHVFRRGTDGSWKMIIEIFNSNDPM